MKSIAISMLVFLNLVAYSHPGAAQSRLSAELDRVEDYLTQRDSLAVSVSAVDVAWHLDHLLKVITGIYSALEYSDPKGYSSSFKPVRTLVFTTGRMPRGVGKAPKSVLPPDNIRTEDVLAQLATARALLPMLEELDKRQYFDHPVFGVLNRKRTAKFLLIHTRHHLRIVKDIIKASKKQDKPPSA